MKSVLIIASVALALPSVAFGQSAKVKQAEAMTMANNFTVAKKSIDEAMAHPKTQNDAYTYAVASYVYASAAKAEPATVFKVKEFLEKAYELDQQGKKPGKNLKKIQKLLPDITKGLFNSGAELFGKKNYAEASKAFETQLWVNSKTENYVAAADSDIMLNAGLASYNAQEWARGAEFLMMSTKYSHEPKSYIFAVECYKQLKDDANVERVLKEGYERYPNSTDMLNSLIDYYNQAGRDDDAMTYINLAIKKNPTFAPYYRARGTLLSKKDLVAAIDDYKKAVELAPEDFASNYYLAWSYSDLGDHFKREAGDAWRDQKKADALSAKSDEYYKLAAPIFEKTVNLTDNVEYKKQCYEKLRNIYYATEASKNIMDNYNRINAIYKSL